MGRLLGLRALIFLGWIDMVKDRRIRLCLYIAAVFCLVYFVVVQVMSPGIWSFTNNWAILGILLIWIARTKRIFSKRTLAVFWSAIGVAAFLTSVTLFFIATPDIGSLENETEYVIVLGGGIKKNGTLSRVPLRRLEAAAEYLRHHPQSRAIVSGGKLPTQKYSEAPELKRCLAAMGVEESRILEEGQALDTIQNFYYSARMIGQEKGIPVEQVLSMPVTVVTSRFHLARAERLARRMGFKNVNGIASGIPLVYVPNTYAREVLAYAKLNLRILLTGKPCLIYE